MQTAAWPQVRLRQIATLRHSSPHILVSRSRDHVAYVVVVRGAFDEWETRVAWHELYPGKAMRRVFMVQDRRAHRTYAAVFWPRFTLDGQHLFYCAEAGWCQAVVIDGVESPPYDQVWDVQTNPLTGQVAYCASTGDRQVLGVDGAELALPYDVHEFCWSPNGRRLAYLAHVQDKWVVVVDGVKGEPYDEVSMWSSMFSPDSASYAYAARRGGEWFYVVDGAPQPSYSSVGSSVVWTGDARRLAYLAERDGSHFVIVGGHVEPARPGMAWNLASSPDGQRLAYISGTAEGARAVIDQHAGPLYSEISAATPVTFSPDGRRFVYRARKATPLYSRVLVVDGCEEPVDARRLAFSPDSRHFAYVSRQQDGDALVVDGRTRDERRGINPFWFSPDSRHVAYVVHASTPSDLAYFPRVGPEPVGGHAAIDVTQRDKVRVVVDGQPGPEFRGVCLQADCFRAGSLVEYVAVRGKKVYQVEQSVPDRDWVSR